MMDSGHVRSLHMSTNQVKLLLPIIAFLTDCAF